MQRRLKAVKEEMKTKFDQETEQARRKVDELRAGVEAEAKAKILGLREDLDEQRNAVKATQAQAEAAAKEAQEVQRSLEEALQRAKKEADELRSQLESAKGGGDKALADLKVSLLAVPSVANAHMPEGSLPIAQALLEGVRGDLASAVSERDALKGQVKAGSEEAQKALESERSKLAAAEAEIDKLRAAVLEAQKLVHVPFTGWCFAAIPCLAPKRNSVYCEVPGMDCGGDGPRCRERTDP